MTAFAPTAFEVKRRQTYKPCDPSSPSRPFVVDSVYDERVRVWDPEGGLRKRGCYRWVARRNLHATALTKNGKPRRTGFYLHSWPTKAWQELCGTCMTWVDEEEIAIFARGYGYSTCKPCHAEIEARYGKPGRKTS